MTTYLPSVHTIASAVPAVSAVSADTKLPPMPQCEWKAIHHSSDSARMLGGSAMAWGVSTDGRSHSCLICRLWHSRENSRWIHDRVVARAEACLNAGHTRIVVKDHFGDSHYACKDCRLVWI